MSKGTILNLAYRLENEKYCFELLCSYSLPHVSLKKTPHAIAVDFHVLCIIDMKIFKFKTHGEQILFYCEVTHRKVHKALYGYLTDNCKMNTCVTSQ